VFYLSTNAMHCNVTATWRAHRRGAYMSNPCYTQIHPTCIPQHGDFQSKLTLMSESLRNDGRVWVPAKAGDKRNAASIPDAERDYFLERKYPSFGNMVPRDVASRNAKYMCDEGQGVGNTGRAVYLDFRDATERDGEKAIRERYGNLFQMYEKITGENPYKMPMKIYPAPHYTMGGLWVDYNLMSNVPGLFVVGEANFSDHGANRLGASALMQGLADGYFVLPYTIAAFLAGHKQETVNADHPAARQTAADAKSRLDKLLAVGKTGNRSAESFHREVGMLMLDKVGMSRSAEGLAYTMERVRQIRDEFWQSVRIPGEASMLNPEVEKAGRVADFLEFAELMARDALTRNESCGGHFREEFQTPEGEALRDDENFCHVTAWEYTDVNAEPVEHREHLTFDFVKLTQRSYK
jgi:succinate dehydrogenase / fumarate reductase flavoprotein subunit